MPSPPPRRPTRAIPTRSRSRLPPSSSGWRSQSGTAILAEEVADLPECGVAAQTQAQGFFATLTEDSQDLLAETTANPDQADAVTEFVEKATTSATELNDSHRPGLRLISNPAH